MGMWTRFKDGFKHAFAIGVEEELTDEEHKVLEKITNKVKKKRLVLPAVIFLESTRPLNLLGSQVLVGLKPFVELVTDTADYDTLTTALEKRVSIDTMIGLLEKDEGS